MRVLVTGGGGFVGSHVVRLLRAREHACSITRRGSAQGEAAVQRLELPDDQRCTEILEASRPDAVVHLAGMSSPGDAAASPRKAWDVNADGTLSVLRALRHVDPTGEIRFVLASTAQIYDPRSCAGPNEPALDESAPLAPQNWYAQTKLAAELAAELSRLEGRRGIVVFRSFNHIGPGQRPAFAAAAFARQIVAIERGQSRPLVETGNLEPRRDFCDVRDAAEAYVLAAEGRLPPGTYNLCSGKSVSLREIVECLRELAGIDFTVRERPDLVRRGEPLVVRGDARKIFGAVGWVARIRLRESLQDVLASARKDVDG